jgi:uncharacterized protein (TIGR02679 family)
MSMPADERILRLLGGPHLASLRQRLRQRFERAAVEGRVGSFRIAGLTADEHAALATLQGLSPRLADSIQVDVARIDVALRDAGVAHSLHDALARLDGPILHARTVRNHVTALWSEALADCTHSGLATLLETTAGLALLKRLSKRDPGAAAEMLHLVSAVLQRLPVDGVTRAQLAAEVMGDPHALDKGKPIAALVLAVGRQVWPGAKQVADEQRSRDESVRDTWARAGVLVNELARPAMFLNLPMDSGKVYGACPGEPSYLSLRALLRNPPRWNVAGRYVFVCENPNVMAIVADRLGERCAPMVCTDGMPSAAQQALLSQLVQAGACLQYHGDYDWAGLRIGNHVMRAYGAKPWRFGAQDYMAAVQAAPRVMRRLAGREAYASWDEALTPAMRKQGWLVSEEGVVDQLLPDLQVCLVDIASATGAS